MGGVEFVPDGDCLQLRSQMATWSAALRCSALWYTVQSYTF